MRGYLTAAFVVSSLAIAFAGALLAPRVRILDPDSFGVLDSIFMLAYPIVGGMQSIWGGLIGGGGLRILPELLRPVADYQELFFATLVIFVVMFFPGGVTELIRRAAGRLVSVKRERPRALTAGAGHCRLSRVSSPAAGEHADELLVVEAVDKHFDALHAVDAASLTVPAGGIHGLIGPNGAGKTSLFNIISGFLDADRGRVDFRRNIAARIARPRPHRTRHDPDVSERRDLRPALLPRQCHHRARPQCGPARDGGKLRPFCRRRGDAAANGAAHSPPSTRSALPTALTLAPDRCRSATSGGSRSRAPSSPNRG